MHKRFSVSGAPFFWSWSCRPRAQGVGVDSCLLNLANAFAFMGKVQMGALKWGIKKATLCNPRPSAIMHICGLLGPLFEGNFRPKKMTIVGNRGQLRTSTLSPRLGHDMRGVRNVWGRKTYQRTHPPEYFWTPPKELLVRSVADSLQEKQGIET